MDQIISIIIIAVSTPLLLYWLVAVTSLLRRDGSQSERRKRFWMPWDGLLLCWTAA